MQVKFEFDHGPMVFLTELSLLRKKIQFPLSNFCLDVCIKVKIACVGFS
jgi:hypothetical protein